MADHELRLVSKIVRAADIKPALERGIDTSWFVNRDARFMWDTIVDHYSRYGQVPAVATLKNALPGCTILKVDESYDYLIDAFVEWRREALTTKLLQDAAGALDDGYEAAIAVLARGLSDISDLALPTSYDVDLTKTWQQRIDDYLTLRGLKDSMVGIPTGFPTIDRATLGLQPQQLITIVATAKAGKSTLTEKISTNIHSFGKVPLLISFEMSNQEQSRRIDTMLSGVAHRKLMGGDISDLDERRLRRALEKLDGAHPFHLIADPSSTATVSAVAAKIETYKPDVVFIDGVYLMRDEVTGEHNSPQALTNITRALKRLAQRFNLPIVMSTQALTHKLRGGQLVADSIGYSSSFFQDSDVTLGLQEVDEDENNTERLLRILGSRNCGYAEAVILWDWETGRFEEAA